MAVASPVVKPLATVTLGDLFRILVVFPSNFDGADVFDVSDLFSVYCWFERHEV